MAPFAEKVELLKTISGVDDKTAESLLAEIGVDMSRFPTHRHLASWAGMCPGNDESAGKRRSGKTRKGSKWLRDTLVQAAHAGGPDQGDLLGRSVGPVARPARGKTRRRGRRALDPRLRLLHPQPWGPYQELGEDWLLTKDRDRQTQRLVKQLSRLGHIVSLRPAEVVPG